MTSLLELTSTPAWLAAVTAATRQTDVRGEMINDTGVQVLEVPFTQLSVQRAAEISCNLVITDPALIPMVATDPLDFRSGLRFRAWWRLLVDGVWQEIPLCTVRLEDPDSGDSGRVSATLTGRGPMALARRGGYRGQVIEVGGLTVTAALRLVFDTVAPGTVVRIPDTTITLPAGLVLSDGDPGKDIAELAATAGWIVWEDRWGAVDVGPQPSSAQIRAQLAEGPDCPVTDTRRKLVTSTIRNRVVVVSTSSEVQPVITGIKEDIDEGSPTWVGRFGPYQLPPVESDMVATQEAADNLAATLLAEQLRPTEEVEIQLPPRPDLEPWDRVQLARQRIGVSGEYQIDQLRFDRPSPTMTISMATRRVL